jgi:O-antigen ligase
MSLGVSAHNIYLTLIAELGIVGLVFYLGWLKSIWRESADLISAGSKHKGSRFIFLPVEVKALLVAMLVSLFGGEILYPYRPSFAFMGMFLFLCAMLNHRALVLGDRNVAQDDQPKHSIRIRPIVKSRLERPVRLYGRVTGA